MAAWAVSICGRAGGGGAALVVVRSLVTAVASLVLEHGLQWLWHMNLVALQHVGSLRISDGTHISCTNR